MSIWVRVIATKSVADITPEALRRAIVERLPLLASMYGEDDADAVAPLVAVEEARAVVEGFASYRLRWAAEEPSAEQGAWVTVERWLGDRAKVEIDELREAIQAYAKEEPGDEGVAEVLACLDSAVETIAFELKLSHTEGIAWPVIMSAAHAIAVVGDGLVQADGEGWMQPDGNEFRSVLASD